jgi:hypothetical protein
MNVQEVENMTLAQKRMAAMIMETTAEDVEAHRARQAAAEADAAAAVGNVGSVADEDAPMEESDDEDDEVKQRRKREEDEHMQEMERTKAIQASSLDVGGTMKIRTDYVPKSKSVHIYVKHVLNRQLLFSWLQKSKAKHDDMLHLWPTSAGQRITRTYANRVVGSEVEVTT